MPNFTDLELPILLDLLVKHTSKYTKMLSSHTSTVDEISDCKEILKEIHAAIEVKHGGTSQMKIVMPEQKEQTDEQ